MTSPRRDHVGSTLTDSTLNGLLWMSWGKAARAVIQLGVLAGLARLVSPAGFGLVNAALVVIEFSTIFTHLGLGKALVQHPRLGTEHIATAFSISVFLGLLLGGAMWIVAGEVADLFRIEGLAPVLGVLALCFPLKALSAASEALLQRDLEFRWLATRELASYAIGYGGCGLTLAFLGYGVWALVAGHVAQSTLNTALLLWARPIRLPWTPHRGALRELVYFGGGYTLGRLANYAAHQGDQVIVARALGPAALGLYGRAAQLMAVPAELFGDILDNVLFPALARVQEDRQRLATVYRRGVSLIALVMLPASVASWLLAPQLVRTLLGPQWDEAIPVMRLFAIALLFRTSCRMSDAIARATGCVYRRAWRQWFYAALVIGGAIVGVRWGAQGVALGVAVALVVNFVLMAQLSLAIAGLTWHTFAAAHVPGTVLALVSAAVIDGVAVLVSALRLGAVAHLALAVTLTAACLVMLARSLPSLCIGRDGLWMVGQIEAHAPALRRLNLLHEVRS